MADESIAKVQRAADGDNEAVRGERAALPTPWPINRPGHAEVEAASRLASDAAEWWPFLRDVLKLPASMLPAVRYAVKANRWRVSKDPVGQLRNAAVNRRKRWALNIA